MRSATLVSARTFEYDNRPGANAASSNGNLTSAVATRTYSLAAPTATEHAHDNQCAHDTTPHCAQPFRRSNSAISRSHSHVDAAKRPASEQIRASNRSSGTSPASSAGRPGDTGGRRRGTGAHPQQGHRHRRSRSADQVPDRTSSPAPPAPGSGVPERSATSTSARPLLPQPLPTCTPADHLDLCSRLEQGYDSPCFSRISPLACPVCRYRGNAGPLHRERADAVPCSVPMPMPRDANGIRENRRAQQCRNALPRKRQPANRTRRYRPGPAQRYQANRSAAGRSGAVMDPLAVTYATPAQTSDPV